jgi:uncharacterized protein YndB with AHSA1/START domain
MEQMNQTGSDKTRMPRMPADMPVLKIERIMDAPMERIWRAWSEPDLVKQWWGPQGYSCPEAKITFREGGQYTFAMKSPEGKVIWSSGTYQKIDPTVKIAFTDYFSDEFVKSITAAQAGMPDFPDLLFVTVELSKKAGETLMTITHEGIPEHMKEDCRNGWNQSFDKMQRLCNRI